MRIYLYLFLLELCVCVAVHYTLQITITDYSCSRFTDHQQHVAWLVCSL
jgi:hypothetical protein